MKIIVAESAGFCFGVNRAIDTVYQNAEQQDHDIFTLGPIIHNTQVVEELVSKGVKVIDDIVEVKSNCARVIIRTHGISKKIYHTISKSPFECIDATCPYVKKIHGVVEKYHSSGYHIVIIGNPDHPEVIGINGWCDNKGKIIDNVQHLDAILSDFSEDTKLCVVAQTTFNREKWDEIIKKIKKSCTDTVFFDTICSATNLRQKEAEKIAKQVDVMLVIGGKHSSNTQKLTEVCRQYCDNTYHIETYEDIPIGIDFQHKKIGITAGASTPAWITKEVISKMSENEKLQGTNEEVSFEEAFEQSLVTLNTGDVVTGKVIGFSESEVYVDLGYKSDGIISAEELTDDPSDKISDIVKVGDKIEVFIVRVNDGEGNVQLSKRKVDFIKGWEEIEDAYNNKEILTGKVVQIVKGGVLALAKGIRVFIPASHLSDRYVSNLEEFLKKSISFKIIDINSHKKRVVGSAKEVIVAEKEKQAENFWSSMEVGKRYIGTVKQLTKFGAFVELGPVDGLIHISELSWSKIRHPSEVVKAGDIVDVDVIDFDKDKSRISLGFKKAEDNPWEIIKSKFNVNDVVKCKVVRLVPFGAFVELVPGIDGLIHISQISNKRIGKPDEVLTLGKKVEAKITELDLEKQKISLSIRELLPVEEAPHQEEQKPEDDLPKEYKEEVNVTIGDAFNQKNGDNTASDDAKEQEKKEEN